MDQRSDHHQQCVFYLQNYYEQELKEELFTLTGAEEFIFTGAEICILSHESLFTFRSFFALQNPFLFSHILKL